MYKNGDTCSHSTNLSRDHHLCSCLMSHPCLVKHLQPILLFHLVKNSTACPKYLIIRGLNMLSSPSVRYRSNPKLGTKTGAANIVLVLQTVSLPMSPSGRNIVSCDWLFVRWLEIGTWHLHRTDLSSCPPAAFGSGCLASGYTLYTCRRAQARLHVCVCLTTTVRGIALCSVSWSGPNGPWGTSKWSKPGGSVGCV